MRAGPPCAHPRREAVSAGRRGGRGQLREMTDIAALALDLHLPDHPEDRIACCIKCLLDERLAPGTWHVLVGRSFGFSVQVIRVIRAIRVIRITRVPDAGTAAQPSPSCRSGPPRTAGTGERRLRRCASRRAAGDSDGLGRTRMGSDALDRTAAAVEWDGRGPVSRKRARDSIRGRVCARARALVGQSEARHFVHLHMQHLAIIIWKYEPDPAPTAGRLPVPEQMGQEDPLPNPAATPAAGGAGGSAASTTGAAKPKA
jgi:hypothetical protein